MMTKSPYNINYKLIFLLLFSIYQISYAQQDNLDDSCCSTYTLELLPEDSVKFISEDGTTFTGGISKQVDLNFDGLDDLIVNFGLCGNWGDCVYGIYVQQADQQYRCVFTPDYWYSGVWEVLENDGVLVDGEQWMKIQLYTRVHDGSGIPNLEPTPLLQFDGKKYRNIEFGYHENE